jgi:hypothetical protein
MHRVGFEPTITLLERVKLFHVLDRAAAVTGFISLSQRA